MNDANEFLISWNAPIVPSVSLAGIPLYAEAAVVDEVVASCLLSEHSAAYKFDGAPLLKGQCFQFDANGNGGYLFSLFDEGLINKLNAGTPALTISIREGKVYAVKVYDFSFPGESVGELVYKGVLPGGIGLGSLVADLLKFTELEFDEGEEWFYTDSQFGGLEVSGWGVPLAHHPDQIVTALCVIGS